MSGSESFPAQIGKYRLIASLGSGGMAQVFLAVASGASGVNKLLVLKVMHRELAQEENFRRMFLDEARLAARLNHPNVVQTYEFGEEDGISFIAMEYVEGQPLSKLVRRRRGEALSLAARVRVLADLLAGLHHAHELTDFDGTPLNVVHRDVSAPNIMVTYAGVVKLMDFGIAAATTASTVTEAGTFKGKVSHAAPEQIRCQKVDARADVFAVGVLLWEALADRRIAEGKSDAQLIHLRVSGLEPSIDEVAPQAPEALRAACRRAMATEPGDRYATAREMQQALGAWLAQQPAVDLGELVTEAFLDERRHLRHRIEEAVRRSREDHAALSTASLELLREGSPSSSTTPSRGQSVSDLGSDPVASSATVRVVGAAPAARAPRSSRGPWVALGLVVALAAGLLAARGLRSPGAASSPAAAASSAAAASASEPPAASARAAASPEAAATASAAAPVASGGGGEAGRGGAPAVAPTRAGPASTRVSPVEPESDKDRGRPGRKVPTRSIDTDLPY